MLSRYISLYVETHAQMIIFLTAMCVTEDIIETISQKLGVLGGPLLRI
jgi:hypothetical protein